MKRTETHGCPCGGETYAICCARYLEGRASAPTAERLMRSRYTAYVLGRTDYLRDTWHASTRPSQLESDAVTWLGLRVVGIESGGVDDERGIVEFIARYKRHGRAQRLHEVSCFIKEHARWFYLDGEVRTT